MVKIYFLIFCLALTSISFAQVQTGKASFYADKFEGSMTASGEKYKHSKLTAAHKSLPFGTKVRVTNLANEQSAEVVINDRGPYVESRIIDLSYATAQLLGFRERGTERVRLDIVKPETMAATRDLIGLNEKPVN